MIKYYAHSLKDQPPEKWQLLSDHLKKTAVMTEKFGYVFGCHKTAYYLGLLHDMGKYTQAFQDYLMKSIKQGNVRRGDVIHALQGAKYIDELLEKQEKGDKIVSDILCNIIASHHNGLFDTITGGKRTVSCKMDKPEEKLFYSEIKEIFKPIIDCKKINDEIISFCKKSKEKKLNIFFMLHLLTKGLYSCLVDADRCNSACLKLDDGLPHWEEAIQCLDSYISKFSVIREIDRIRQKLSSQCKKAGEQEQGIYTLSLPTGAGKTLSSLRFALTHAQRHKLKRIIYVIPYLSIIDQTSSEFRKVFGSLTDSMVLEHHSNMEVSEDMEPESVQKLLSSRWDCPIILTTMVQFLETVYSNKASKLRKFHNMTESILIFDEVQSLPIKCIHLFNEAINFLNIFGNSSILLCTATQPHLHKTLHPIFLNHNAELIHISKEEEKVFKRVHVVDSSNEVNTPEKIAILAKKQINSGKNTLIILNTKRSALKVYEACSGVKCYKFFLTTDLCPAHRMSLLKQLQSNLESRDKLLSLCISTQLIEAGVDVSFDCVIRAKAGLDSIVQAAGRCNRNGESPKPQNVFVVQVENEELSWLPEIKEGKNITSRVFRENLNAELISNEVVASFYEYYFYDQKSKMNFDTKDGKKNIYNLLSSNELSKDDACRNNNGQSYNGLPCAFETAANEFSVIDSSQTGVVVPYGEGVLLIQQFVKSYEPKEKIRILKMLQRYTVSVYENILNNLIVNGAVDLVENSFYVLSVDYYDQEQGLKREALNMLLNV